MSKEIRSTIYMKEEMYEKFRSACNYKFGDKQGKIKKGMLTAIEFFIEVVNEEKALAKKNQATSTPEPELSGLIEEGVIDSEPTHQDKPIDFTENFDESPTLSAKSSNQAEQEKTFPYEEIPKQPSVVTQEVAEENIDEIDVPPVPLDQDIEPEVPMVSRQEPPPNLAELSYQAKVPQQVVEEEIANEELDQVAETIVEEVKEQSEGAKIVQDAIEREAEASVALDHDPNLQTVTEKPQLDQDEKPPQEVVEVKPDVTDLAKRLAEERRKRNLA